MLPDFISSSRFCEDSVRRPDRLREFFDVNAISDKRCETALHLPRIKDGFLDSEALLQIDQCALDGGLEIQRLVG